jgi:hypothetical protein
MANESILSCPNAMVVLERNRTVIRLKGHLTLDGDGGRKERSFDRHMSYFGSLVLKYDFSCN